jgi:S1-C subfamily serine protease
MRGTHRTFRLPLLLQTILLMGLVGALASCRSVEPAPAGPQSMAPGLDAARPSIVAITAIIDAGPTPELATKAQGWTGVRLAAAVQGSTRSAGTGFVIAPGGYILTAEHVVNDAVAIWVTTHAGEVQAAELVAVNHEADLALLKVDALDLPVLPRAAAAAQRGDAVYALGNPGGRATCGELILTSGTVDELGRVLRRLSREEKRRYEGMIQSKMAITPGDSGGPLLNARGELVGMSAAAVLASPTCNAYGYAFPADQAWHAKVAQLLPQH